MGPARMSGGRRRRSDAERNIRAIVESATGVLASNSRASMQDVAEAAGVHRATVHRHFATRDELLLAVREQALDEFASVVNDPELAAMEPSRALEELTRRSLELGDRNRVYRVTPSFDEASDAREAELAGPLIAILGRAQQAGAVRGDLPPEHLAMAWGGLVLAVLPRLAAGLTLRDGVGFVRAMLATSAAGPARG